MKHNPMRDKQSRYAIMQRFLTVEPARTAHEADMERCAADNELAETAESGQQMDWLLGVDRVDVRERARE